MKSKLFLISILLVGAVSMLSAFTSKEAVLAPTGGLSVQLALTDGGKEIASCPVSLANSEEQLASMEYVAEAYSDAKGVADFGQLATGTYYVEASAESKRAGKLHQYQKSEKVVVVAGKNQVVKLVLPVIMIDFESVGQ